jgi:hypothetical protein
VISRVQSRRLWEKLNKRRELDGRSSASSKSSKAAKEEDKRWPRNLVYGAAGVASIVVPYMLAWITVSVPWLRSTLLSKSQVESLRRHFGDPEPYYAAYTETLNREGATDPILVPSVLPGEGSPQEEATAEAIERHLHETVRVELAMVPFSSSSSSFTSFSSALGEEQQQTLVAAMCLKLPGSIPANEETLRRYYQDILPPSTGPGDLFVIVNYPDDDDDGNDKREATDSATLMHRTNSTIYDENLRSDSSTSTTEPAGVITIEQDRDPLLRTIPVYSTWHYQAPLPTLHDSQRRAAPSTHHPVTGQLYNTEELQIRHLEAEILRLQAELSDRNTTRPFDDIQDDLDRSRSQLRRLRWRRWVPWW